MELWISAIGAFAIIAMIVVAGMDIPDEALEWGPQADDAEPKGPARD